MTFLEMVRRVVQYAAITNATPATVASQTGDVGRVVTWVQDAHDEIQSMYFDWDFLWATDTLTTQADTPVYQGPTDLGIWDADSVRLDGDPIDVWDWQNYTPDDRDSSRPAYAVIRPDNQIQLVPPPDDAYTLSFDYFKPPKALVDSEDEPLIPSQFHMAIVGRALMLCANYEAAEDIKQQGQELYGTWLQQLERHQLSRRQQTHGRMEARDITVVPE